MTSSWSPGALASTSFKSAVSSPGNPVVDSPLQPMRMHCFYEAQVSTQPQPHPFCLHRDWELEPCGCPKAKRCFEAPCVKSLSQLGTVGMGWAAKGTQVHR